MANMTSSYFPAAPHWLFGLIFWSGVILTIVPFPAWGLWTVCRKRLSRAFSGLIVFGCLGSLFLIGKLWIGPTINKWSSGPQPPNVSLCLLNENHPRLVILNRSNEPVEKIKYTPVMYDIDSPNPEEPLHVMVDTFDLIGAGGVGGPQDIFVSGTAGPSVIKLGDRLAGSIGITCPKCLEGKTYWVSINWGTGGWYAQIEGQTSGGAIIPSQWIAPGSTSHWSVAQFIYRVVEAVPQASRIPIRSIAEPIETGGKLHLFTITECVKK
jgi:hypothetical protein